MLVRNILEPSRCSSRVRQAQMQHERGDARAACSRCRRLPSSRLLARRALDLIAPLTSPHTPGGRRRQANSNSLPLGANADAHARRSKKPTNRRVSPSSAHGWRSLRSTRRRAAGRPAGEREATQGPTRQRGEVATGDDADFRGAACERENAGLVCGSKGEKEAIAIWIAIEAVPRT